MPVGYTLSHGPIFGVHFSASTPTVSTVAGGAAVAGGVDNGGDGAVEYVQASGVWVPSVAVDKVISKTTAGKTSGLFISERSGSSWVQESSPVLLRSGTDQADGYFSNQRLLAFPGANPDHSTLALVAPHCGMTVYAERVNGLNGGWSYFDAGPVANVTVRGGQPLQLAYDAIDQEVIVTWKPAFDGATPLQFARRSSFRPLAGRPSENCAQVTADASVPRETIPMPASGIAALNQVGAGGVAEQGGATFATLQRAEPNNKANSLSLAWRCAPSDPWQERSIDIAHSGQKQPLLGSDGSLSLALTWGLSGGWSASSYLSQPADAIYISNGNNPCPGI